MKWPKGRDYWDCWLCWGFGTVVEEPDMSFDYRQLNRTGKGKWACPDCYQYRHETRRGRKRNMGSDIYTYVEVFRGDKWHALPEDLIRTALKIVRPHDDDPAEYDDDKQILGWRNYGIFGFLGDYHNLSKVPSPFGKRGLPGRPASEKTLHDPMLLEYRAWSHVTAKELLDYNYEVVFDDHRHRQVVGKNKDIPTKKVLRDFLGPTFFLHVAVLAALADYEHPEHVRLIYGFSY